MKLEIIITNSKGISHSFICTGKTMAIRQVVSNLLKTPDINAHPNIFWIDSEQKKVNIEEIRSIKDFMYRTTYHADLPKLIVITCLNNLNLNSLNALLKLIEEPTANTYFILLSHNIEALPSTIRSRSIVINFVPQDETAIDLTLYNQLLDLLQSTPTKLYKFIEKNFSNLEQLEIFHLVIASVARQSIFLPVRDKGGLPRYARNYECWKEITYLLSNAKTFGLDPKTVVLIVIHKLKDLKVVA